jgi:hypothetical protein
MNIKNLNKLLAHLKRQKKSKYVNRFNMAHWGERWYSGMRSALRYPVCRTQACLAGETILALKLGKIHPNGGIDLLDRYSSILFEASNELGLTTEQRDRLFYLPNWNNGVGWPQKFVEQYNKAKTPAGRLAVAIRRVEHFIKTEGAE